MIPFLLLAEIVTTKPKMGPIEKERKIVVDAVRGCPEHEEGEIVICANDRGFAESYRLPKLDPRFDITREVAGRGALTDRSLGAGGTGSCTTTGAGGSTGCTLRGIGTWAEAERRKKAAERAYEDPN